jgi:hypothetical protein
MSCEGRIAFVDDSGRIDVHEVPKDGCAGCSAADFFRMSENEISSYQMNEPYPEKLASLRSSSSQNFSLGDAPLITTICFVPAEREGSFQTNAESHAQRRQQCRCRQTENWMRRCSTAVSTIGLLEQTRAISLNEVRGRRTDGNDDVRRSAWN